MSMTILRRGMPGIAAGALLAAAGVAKAAQSWDGTWAGGWENGDGVQIIIAGDKVIGVFRDGDYPDILRSQLSADGKTLTFGWSGGDGTLQRTDERDATFTLHERGKPARSFLVHRE
jgi:hypothetical protein